MAAPPTASTVRTSGETCGASSGSGASFASSPCFSFLGVRRLRALAFFLVVLRAVFFVALRAVFFPMTPC